RSAPARSERGWCAGHAPRPRRAVTRTRHVARRGLTVTSTSAGPSGEPAADGCEEAARVALHVRLVNVVVVVLPLCGLVAAGVLLWGRGFRWVELGLLTGMYTLTALGITVGFHRLFTHRSFETNGAVRVVLAVLGSMAVQGPLLRWVALHRRHHQHSDRPGDPHSPHDHGHGLLGLLRGLWHAHIGWVFQPEPPDLPHYPHDLARDGAARTARALV